MYHKTEAQLAAEQHLGALIKEARRLADMDALRMAKAINVTTQQLAKYEQGAFVPLPVIEAITDTLGERVPKKTIRRISFLRKLEKDKGVDESEQLIFLYDETFAPFTETAQSD